jgi:hypothetical protein
VNLRDRGAELRGKLVGREGVEPSTKRLRVSLLTAKKHEKSRVSPLSGVPIFMRKSPSRPVDLRDGIPVGRHGSFQILEIRDERGRKSLRYVKDAETISG